MAWVLLDCLCCPGDGSGSRIPNTVSDCIEIVPVDSGGPIPTTLNVHIEFDNPNDGHPASADVTLTLEPGLVGCGVPAEYEWSGYYTFDHPPGPPIDMPVRFCIGCCEDGGVKYVLFSLFIDGGTCTVGLTNRNYTALCPSLGSAEFTVTDIYLNPVLVEGTDAVDPPAVCGFFSSAHFLLFE